jgi:hypothetical protein
MHSQSKPLEGLENLEEKLNKLISEKAGISQDEVTNDWIMEQREENIYPTAKPSISSKKGGYIREHLKFLTQVDCENIIGVNEARDRIFQRSN